MGFELAQVRILLRNQDGVVSRRQLVDHGAARHDLARLVRRRELTPTWRGVFVTHSGPLTSRQRHWVAVLAAWPAALAGASALPAAVPGPTRLVVGPGRQLLLPPGTRVRRVDHLDSEVLWHRSPPRQCPEHAVIDVMSARIAEGDTPGAFHELTQALHAQLTDADAVLAALADRPRVGGRHLIHGMLQDAAIGACSVLERGYLHDVERAHGLPRADRQRRSTTSGRQTSQDLHYPDFGMIIELDGDAYHRGRQRDDDAWRDLAELAGSHSTTLRLTYGLVFGSPCRTAQMLAAVLTQRGWTGSPTRCADCARSR